MRGKEITLREFLTNQEGLVEWISFEESMISASINAWMAGDQCRISRGYHRNDTEAIYDGPREQAIASLEQTGYRSGLARDGIAFPPRPPESE